VNFLFTLIFIYSIYSIYSIYYRALDTATKYVCTVLYVKIAFINFEYYHLYFAVFSGPFICYHRAFFTLCVWTDFFSRAFVKSFSQQKSDTYTLRVEQIGWGTQALFQALNSVIRFFFLCTDAYNMMQYMVLYIHSYYLCPLRF